MPKTTFKVRTKQWELFNRECRLMSFRRDEVIDRVLPIELAILGEMPPCDEVGSRWLKGRWVTMWRSTDVVIANAPVMLSEPVLNQLNQTCIEKGIPRDAFFDCVLEFLTVRFYEPALVIKDPRTNKDLVSRVVALIADDDLDDRDAERALFEEASDLIKERNVSCLTPSFYQNRLSYNTERVEEQLLIFQSL